jgi:hypothetical protein
MQGLIRPEAIKVHGTLQLGLIKADQLWVAGPDNVGDSDLLGLII